MVATLGAAQGKNGSTTLEVTLINCDYQLIWLKIVVNGEMQSNRPDMFQSPTLLYKTSLRLAVGKTGVLW